MKKLNTKRLIGIIRRHFPRVQAIYLFGSAGTENERPDSDVDIALLLKHEEVEKAGPLLLHPLKSELESLLGKTVDLINLRKVSTVFQKEIIMDDRRIYCADEPVVDEFEMLTLSFYQKLNEERANIIKEALKNGKFYNV